MLASNMSLILRDKSTDLDRLCIAFHVQRLEAFGSILRDDFGPASSDIDFLVEFDGFGIEHYADSYFGFLEALQSLFGRRVDLIVISSLKNPYFIESINANKMPLYAA